MQGTICTNPSLHCGTVALLHTPLAFYRLTHRLSP